MTVKEKGMQSGILLEQAVRDYLLWMIDRGYTHQTWLLYERLLGHFSVFINQQSIAWENIFTFETMKAFQKKCKLNRVSMAIRGLARYLHAQQRIPLPLKKQPRKLPRIYEEYLCYYSKTRQAGPEKTPGIRRVLTALHDYLTRDKIQLTNVRIEHLDDVLSEHNAGLTPEIRRTRRSWLRGFLRYLYQVRGILPKDLASLVVGAPQYAHSKPPKFLRPHEVQQLFHSIEPGTPRELRTNAMLHLAYSLGLRPKEISLISLDDISFSNGEISLTDRKCQNPIKLPLPEVAIKAIAAYIIGARPKTGRRTLFLELRAPYNPVSPGLVSQDIGSQMHKAGLHASAYWLRHTYAQNLLEADTSIFEIKEMMGHDRIQTTRRYLHIHTRLMRETLFNETL